MYIIKLNAIDSTNSYLRKLGAEGRLSDFTVVTAEEQTDGRGQMGAKWVSEGGKNLILSVFKKFPNLESHHNFKISMIVSIALITVLKEFNLRNLKIKWPNDILSDNYKIGGILIENVIKHKATVGTIIGIGLNINQQKFNNLPSASSLKILTGNTFNRDEVLIQIVETLKQKFDEMEHESISEVRSKFEAHLFRLNKPSTFSNNDEEYFTGYIQGVTDYGKLVVLLEDEIKKEFDLKEIKMMY